MHPLFICSPNGNRLRSLTPSALFFSISYNFAKNCKNILEKVANLKGKYYGRPVSLGHVSTEKLAQEIAHSSTVTKADILAVLAELSHAMKEHLQNSMTVDLDGIGSFRVGFCSTPTDDEKSFTAGNIKRFQIYYAPEAKFVANGKTSSKGRRKGMFVKTLLDGITAEALEKSKRAK